MTASTISYSFFNIFSLLAFLSLLARLKWLQNPAMSWLTSINIQQVQQLIIQFLKFIGWLIVSALIGATVWLFCSWAIDHAIGGIIGLLFAGAIVGAMQSVWDKSVGLLPWTITGAVGCGIAGIIVWANHGVMLGGWLGWAGVGVLMGLLLTFIVDGLGLGTRQENNNITPQHENPWLKTAGMFADDPTLEPMLEEIYAAREAEAAAIGDLPNP